MRKNVHRDHTKLMAGIKVRPVRNIRSGRRYISLRPPILSLRSQPKSLWDGFGTSSTGNVQCRKKSKKSGKSTLEIWPDTALERDPTQPSRRSICFLNMVARLTITGRTQVWDTEVRSTSPPPDEGGTRYDSELPSERGKGKSKKSKASGTM